MQTSRIRYEITSGNIGGAFAVKNMTGAIYVAGALDYETRKRSALPQKLSFKLIPNSACGFESYGNDSRTLSLSLPFAVSDPFSQYRTHGVGGEGSASSSPPDALISGISPKDAQDMKVGVGGRNEASKDEGRNGKGPHCICPSFLARPVDSRTSGPSSP
ncbi:hypothetical protein J437_LFUL000338 [Ladona fulva]|uniref:Uncharacterized protein n=1 Tax=Ladona fulva TaxID=123851 RepID=A0A8K0JV11_LADFU|nr:hypothetical protein J437_LFUL000338 [Ladona fulva]